MDIKEMVPYTKILIILPVGSTILLNKNDVKIIADLTIKWRFFAIREDAGDIIRISDEFSWHYAFEIFKEQMLHTL